MSLYNLLQIQRYKNINRKVPWYPRSMAKPH